MSLSLTVNTSVTLCCIIFYILLVILYTTKKNMNNIENKIYKRMIILNGIYLFINISSFIIYILINNNVITNYSYFFLAKYLQSAKIYLTGWFILLLFYIFIITKESNENYIIKLNKNYKKYFMFIYIFLFIFSIFHLIEKFDLNLYIGCEDTILKLFNIVTVSSVFIDLFLVLFNIKKINRKKIIPLLIIIPLLSTGWAYSLLTVFLDTDEFILFFHVVITLIDYVMYFTIENPDMKMVAELTLAKDSAEKANNVKTEFLSSMSHELRTPLNAILGLSQLIEDNTNEENTRRDASDIVNSSNTLLELVDGILEVNNFDSNNIEIDNGEYNFYDLVNQISKNIYYKLYEKPIEFKVNISDTIPITLYGDRGKIKSIITNLLTNAVKYTESGFISLTVDCINKDDNCVLKISVSDSGKGIKSEDIDKIFDKFYRSSDNKDSNISGTGLGLSITKSLVVLLGGKISVDSVEGNGSTFMVTVTQKIANSDIETL